MPIVGTKDPVMGIPGVAYAQTVTGAWELRGSVDALEAAGVPLESQAKQGCKDAMRLLTVAQSVPFLVPKGTTLRPFQAVGVPQMLQILRREGAGILADEMGLGKTPQGAVIAENLRRGGSVLVVCPATVRHQWEAWANTVHQGFECANLGPPSEKTFRPEWSDWADGAAVYGTTSYNLMDKALAARSPDVLLFDEPHNFLQGRGNTYVKALWSQLGKVRYRLALDGTPYLSKPAGLWQILNILLGTRFGNAKDFDRRYCKGHEGRYGWDNKGADNIPELTKRLSYYMLRRLKKDVAQQLPPVTYVVRWVEGTTAARGAMANLQYSSEGMRRAQEPALADKIPTVVSVVEETGKPCVVFCWRREDANKVGIALSKAKEQNIVIHGDYDAATRAKRVKEAQKTHVHCVVTYGACATGLDGLQHVSADAVYHSIDPVPAIIMQANARLDRDGQTQPVTSTFVAMHDSVDEITIDRVVNRLEDWATIMGSDKAGEDIRAALIKGGMGDIENDAVLQAIFEEMT